MTDRPGKSHPPVQTSTAAGPSDRFGSFVSTRTYKNPDNTPSLLTVYGPRHWQQTQSRPSSVFQHRIITQQSEHSRHPPSTKNRGPDDFFLDYAFSKLHINPYEVYPPSYISINSSGQLIVEVSPEQPQLGESTFSTTAHLIKSVWGPAVMTMPYAFYNSGIIYSHFGFLLIIPLVTYNVRRLVLSADHLSEREQVPVKTYDQLAYFSFYTCSEYSRKYAFALRHYINVLFISTRLDGCCIMMSIVAAHSDLISDYSYPDSTFHEKMYLFCEVGILLLMNSVRRLHQLSYFSIIGCIVIALVVLTILGTYVTRDLPPLNERRLFGDVTMAIRFHSCVISSFSGLTVSLTLKSTMTDPSQFLSYPGVYCVSSTLIIATYYLFGILGYWKYGEDTQVNIILNMQLPATISYCLRIAVIFALFLSIPINFYFCFNILWANYLNQYVHVTNYYYAEFVVRYLLIVIVFLVALSFPIRIIGPLIILKGALFHTQLEMILPAVLDFVTFYPEKGNGKYKFRLIKMIFIVVFGVLLGISGTLVGVTDLFRKIS